MAKEQAGLFPADENVQACLKRVKDALRARHQADIARRMPDWKPAMESSEEK